VSDQKEDRIRRIFEEMDAEFERVEALLGHGRSKPQALFSDA
jgi:hypothetical protein